MNLLEKPIDSGFYEISRKTAVALAGDRSLPRHGWELLVEHDGQTYWLTQTLRAGKLVWSVRSAQRFRFQWHPV